MIADDTTYKIVRGYYKSYSRRTIKRGLSLEQARAHCSDPETSSRTATSSAARRVTKRGLMDMRRSENTCHAQLAITAGNSARL
jgi:hypothetical protein